MYSSLIHFVTSFLALIFIFSGIFFLILSVYNNKPYIRKTAMVLFILNGIFITIASAFGGVSISRFKELPGVKESEVSYHAWTAMIAFLLSVFLLIYAIRDLRKSSSPKLNFVFFMLSFLVIAFFCWTLIVAFKMGPA